MIAKRERESRGNRFVNNSDAIKKTNAVLEDRSYYRPMKYLGIYIAGTEISRYYWFGRNAYTRLDDWRETVNYSNLAARRLTRVAHCDESAN